MQALAALEESIIVLHEATSAAALVQDKSASAEAMQRAVSGVRTAIDAMPSGVDLSPDQASQVTAFLEAKAGGSPQSATIQGILKDMYDNFAEELEKRYTTEGDANSKYEALVYIKYEAAFATKAEIAKYDKQIA